MVGSDQTCSLERHEGTILVDGLQGAAAELNLHEAAELRNPDALGLQVRREGALHDLGDVTTDTALFLGETGAMDFTTGADAGSSDTANA